MSGNNDRYLYKASKLTPGYNRIVGPGDGGLRLLEFGRLFLTSGKEYTSRTEEREACLNILSGTCSVVLSGSGAEDVEFTALGKRADVFSGNPSMLYLPRETEFRVTAGSGDLQIAMFLCPARRDTIPIRVDGEQLNRQVFGSANWRREACITLGNEAIADRLLVGETYNAPGNWSSYPPHKHDEVAPPSEQPYEEIYFYTVDPPQGFGIQRLYTDRGAPDPLDEVYVVEDGDTVVIPRGYHPVAAAPGYKLSYLWALAGEEREFGQWSDDPNHSWIRSLE